MLAGAKISVIPKMFALNVNPGAGIGYASTSPRYGPLTQVSRLLLISLHLDTLPSAITLHRRRRKFDEITKGEKGLGACLHGNLITNDSSTKEQIETRHGVHM